MRKQLYLIILGALLILFGQGCQNEANQYKGKKVAYIKKDVVHTDDGLALDLGGDSISKIFYLIRHAEKDTQQTDPVLSAAGRARATRLTEIMKNTWLDAVYTTLTSRTMETVDSITQYKGLANSIYTNNNMKETFAELLTSPKVNRVLVAGHSNNIPPLANFLYGKNYFNRTFDEKEYDNFIIVVQLRDSTRQVYELKY